MWHTNIDDWTKVYDLRLKTWLRAIEKAEEIIETKTKVFTLSTYMRESWETGRFWLNYAARKSWAFDTIFWKYLDKRLFGIRTARFPFPASALSLEKKMSIIDIVEDKEALSLLFVVQPLMHELEYVCLGIVPTRNLDLICNFPITLLKPRSTTHGPHTTTQEQVRLAQPLAVRNTIPVT
jgi:hypothetical protein